MNEVEKKVLYKFVELLTKHPDGDVRFLWVQAGGNIASQQSVQRTPEQLDRLHEQLDEIIEVGAGGE